MSLSRIGRYEIEREIGRGAMAVVHKALDPLIGRIVAIKTIRLEHGAGMEQAELKTRLYREARSAGVLNHPNIVTIYDIGEEGEVAYIAMEHIEGETLETWLATHPVPPLDVTTSIVEQIASGLDYAASKGIIHRDIKPGNILLTQDLRAKIADFGIAKFSMSKLTMTGMVMGTPSYMSPEQAMGHEIDGRSDIFSLGVIFYQMLTGERPFVGTNPTTIIYKILHEHPVPPHRLNVTLHPGFDHIVGRMLAKDPAARYQTCGEFIADLKNYAALGPVTTSAPVVDAPETKEKSKATLVLPKRSYLLPTFVLLFVVAAAGLGWFVFTRKPVAAPAHPASAEVSEPVASAPGPAPGASKALESPAETRKAALAPEPVPEKAAPPPEKPALAFLTIAPGAPYSARIMDGGRRIEGIKAGGAAVPVTAGEHRFRAVAEEVFLDRPLETVRLKAGETHAIELPGLGSAYLEVPNDAYDGCEILLNGKMLPPPYPAQVPKLAAGDNRVVFRWTTGPYAGKQANSVVSVQEKGHYLIKAEPESGKVLVQQVR